MYYFILFTLRDFIRATENINCFNLLTSCYLVPICTYWNSNRQVCEFRNVFVATFDGLKSHTEGNYIIQLVQR